MPALLSTLLIGCSVVSCLSLLETCIHICFEFSPLYYSSEQNDWGRVENRNRVSEKIEQSKYFGSS